MKKLMTKSIMTKAIISVMITTTVIAGVIVTSKVMDNKNFANKISNQKAESYTEKKNTEGETATTAIKTETKQNETDEKIGDAQSKTKSTETTTELELQKEIENAKKAVTEAEKELETAKTEQEKTQAKAKVEAAKEEQRKAEQAKEEAEEKAKQAGETTTKVEEEKPKTSSESQPTATPNTVETPAPKANDLETVKKAIENTRNANTMTVTNYIENSTKQFNKATGEEHAVYRSALSLTEKAGTLYSYKTNNSKTLSLFKENGGSEWKMVFSGKRTMGVIELELIKNAYSVEATGDGNYNVKISHSDAKSWLMNYYGSSSVSGEVTITIKTNGTYVQLIKGTVGTREINLALSDIGSTTVPSRSQLGIDEGTINALEEEYKAHYDCERENDYWVCGPHKHVNQYNF